MLASIIFCDFFDRANCDPIQRDARNRRDGYPPFSKPDARQYMLGMLIERSAEINEGGGEKTQRSSLRPSLLCGSLISSAATKG